MQQVSCPTCGAPVSFRSAASVMAVCDYCKSTLVKDADSVKSIGKMSEVLEDYSPIQINASGTVDGRSFTVVGRIQLRYPAGFWNEWYVLDDHGEGAWLSDASGQYTFTREIDAASLHVGPLPRFESLAPGTPLDLGKAPDGSRLVFIASDIRTAQCTGGQGELPFTVGAGYTARVADFRRGNEFLTLDYSDDGAKSGGSPLVYRGRPVTLAEMQCQLLRDPETIKDNAGRFKGKISNLECPSCGSAIAFSPGATTHLLCPSCHAAIDASGPVAEVIAAARRVEAVHTTIALGAKATIAATSYTVIGVMRRAEISEEASEWTEYLLYAPQKGFIWLVETDKGWERADVLDGWPYWLGSGTSANQAVLDGTTYDKLYDYNAVVRHAAGAFNWKVEVGDTNAITEFQHGAVKLAAEANDAELTWSRSTPIAGKDLVQWFGKEVDANAIAQSAPSAVTPPGGYRRAAKWMTILLLAINAIPILFSPGRALVIVILAAVGLYFPAWLLDKAAARSPTS